MKNKMMKISAVLMTAVLLTTSVVSSTYAKYVTTNTGSDGARVAKWGVKIDTNTKGMFSHSYANTEKVNGAATGTSVSVSGAGNDSDYVLAPGTSGSTTISLSGSPEVAVNVQFAMNIESDLLVPVRTQVSNEKILFESYKPIQYTLTNKAGDELAKGSLEDVKTAFNALSAQHAPNSSLNETYTLSWVWPIDGGDALADTYLGNVAAGTITDENTKTNVKFNYTVTVTQID